MKKVTLIAAAAIIVAAVAGLVALDRASAETGSAPPAETITCPITGEPIARDQCPLIDPSRPDCPGKVVCPLTSQLVCRDQCPLDAEVGSGAARDAQGAAVAASPSEAVTPASCCGSER